MSQILSLLSSVDICCPYCEYYNEISDIDVSTTIDYTDIARNPNECAFEVDCTDCGKKFKVNPELNIEVSKILW